MLMVRLILAVVASGVAGTLANSVIVAGPDAKRVHPARPSAPCRNAVAIAVSALLPAIYGWTSGAAAAITGRRAAVGGPPFPYVTKAAPVPAKAFEAYWRSGGRFRSGRPKRDAPAGTLKNRHTLGEDQPGGERLEEANPRRQAWRKALPRRARPPATWTAGRRS